MDRRYFARIAVFRCCVNLETRFNFVNGGICISDCSDFARCVTDLMNAAKKLCDNYPGFPTTRTRLQKGIRLAIYCVFLFIREDHLELATQLPFGCSSEVLSLLPRALNRLVRTGLCQSA